jgi:hypothetical protein
MATTWLAGGFMALVSAAALAATDAQVPGCLHGINESDDQRARRRAAIRYLRDVNAAQTRIHQQRGTYAPLVDAEAAGTTSAPFGFVPRLTLDQWNYAVILKDVLDPCGFSLVADQDNVVYSAQPIREGDVSTSGSKAGA